MNNIFFVHSWRTLLLSYLIIDARSLPTFSVSWIASRGFDSVLESLGHQKSSIYNISPDSFIDPYFYRKFKKNYSRVRALAIELREFAQNKVCSLYLPHFRDVWMQLAASAIAPDQIHYLEEGNVFTRTQSDGILPVTDLVLDDPGVNNYFPSIYLRQKSNPSYFFGTKDNLDLKFSRSILFEDEDVQRISRTLTQKYYVNHPGVPNFSNAVVVIGTKDECNKAHLFRRTIGISSKYINKDFTRLLYKAHPSWTHGTDIPEDAGLPPYLQILSPEIPLDLILYSCNELSSSLFISENSSMLLSANRLGLNALKIPYYLERSHLEDCHLKQKLSCIAEVSLNS